jgi:hypothetical protein
MCLLHAVSNASSMGVVVVLNRLDTKDTKPDPLMV